MTEMHIFVVGNIFVAGFCTLVHSFDLQLFIKVVSMLTDVKVLVNF